MIQEEGKRNPVSFIRRDTYASMKMTFKCPVHYDMDDIMYRSKLELDKQATKKYADGHIHVFGRNKSKELVELYVICPECRDNKRFQSCLYK